MPLIECSRSTYKVDRSGPNCGTVADDAPEGLHWLSLLPQSCLFSKREARAAWDGSKSENNTDEKTKVCILRLGARLGNGRVTKRKIEDEEISKRALNE